MKSNINLSDMRSQTDDSEMLFGESILTSPHEAKTFSLRNELLSELNVGSSGSPNQFFDLLKTKLAGKPYILDENIALKSWKNIANISARLIEKYGEVVLLECLVDKEKQLYEEREFRSSLFDGYDVSIGNYFYLRFFERPNETRLEIHNDPSKSLSKDFPKEDFKELFNRSSLFK